MKQILLIFFTGLLLFIVHPSQVYAQQSSSDKEWKKQEKDRKKQEKKLRKREKKRAKAKRKEEKRRKKEKRNAKRAGRNKKDSAKKKARENKTSKKATEVIKDSSVSSNSLVQEALKHLGTRYKYGGESPRSGFDCSGLVQFVYKKYGTNLPRTSLQQSKQGKKIRLSDAKPGDLVFFSSKGKVNHVGIVISRKGEALKMVHSGSSTGVIVTTISNSNYWKKRLKFVRRIKK